MTTGVSEESQLAARHSEKPVIEVHNLTRTFGRTEAVRGLNLSVRAGTIYGLFGRNGSGKSTTLRCLLNLLQPTSGSVRLFGLDAARDELAIKRRVGYVPDSSAYYPWMTVRQVIDYYASFREKWDMGVEAELMERFRLDQDQRANALSKGQSMQLALLLAICPGPDLLVLDEATTGLDPVIRREFVQAIVGAYQDMDPQNRTILISTHLISEFEGLVDEFTIIEQGKVLMTSEADAARASFRRIRGCFLMSLPELSLPGIVSVRRRGEEIELIVSGDHDRVLDELHRHNPQSLNVESLDLESIFVALLGNRRVGT